MVAQAASSAREPPASDPDLVGAERMRILYRGFAPGTLSSGACALILSNVLAFDGRVSWPIAIGLSAVMGAAVAVHLLLRRAYLRSADADQHWRVWHRRFIAIVGAEGMIWGACAFLLTSPTDLNQELLVAAVSIVMASGAVTVFQASLPVFLVYLFPVMGPHLVIFLTFDYPLSLLMAALVAAYLIAMPLIAQNAYRALLVNIDLRFENEAVARQLERQTRAAEAAGHAKSAFLAAASHDLRQPVHALGLFAGALALRPLDEETRALLGRMTQAIGAIDQLLLALLDISRLDAGAVTPRIETVALGPLLDRLCDEYRVEAQIKGVELRAVATSLHVATDAVLLERVLRNLIGNAVRYTDHGRILVGCRPRAGTAVIAVHDTGPGIAPEHQARVFDEFFQVGNVERDRAKGLGLGLAIVRRTGELLGAPVALRSTPGKGSCFSIAFPIVPAPAVPTLVQQPPPASGRSLDILVIDDERDVLDASLALVGALGHRASGATGIATALSAALDAERVPDLILCDYRLRDGENGLETIAALREEFNRDIPAILITGDTAPERLAEAARAGLEVLHKPVTADQLQRAVLQVALRSIRADARRGQPAAG